MCLAIYGIYCFFSLWFDEEQIILNYCQPRLISCQPRREEREIFGYIIVSYICKLKNRKTHYTPSPLGEGLGVRPVCVFFISLPP